MPDKPKISIIGPGMVGSALARLAKRAGYTIAAVAGGKRWENTKTLAQAVNAEPCEHLAEAASAGQLVLLTVSDRAIVSVCEQLASAGGLMKKPVVAHCCGAMGSDALTAASKAGCPIGAMHPLQTFPDVESALNRLPGAHFFLDGDARACEVLEKLVAEIGGHPVKIDPASKPLYHASAVMSANYLVAMLDGALKLMEQIGLDRATARQAIGPLVRATVENTLAKDTAAALTGPIARGDIETLTQHLKAMENSDPSICKLYRAAGMHTIEIALQKGTINESAAQTLRELLAKK